MNKKLYIGNLAWEVEKEVLNEFFAEAGQVVHSVIILNRDTGKSRGFGFVEMATEDEAQYALENLNGKELEGRNVIVREAQPEGSRGR